MTEATFQPQQSAGDSLEAARLHAYTARYFHRIWPEFDAWRTRFLTRAMADPTARSAWRDLCRHGADSIALGLLFDSGDSARLLRVREEFETLAKLRKRVRRAAQKVYQRKQAGDSRLPMFEQRLQDAVKALDDAPWPCAYPDDYRRLEDVETFRDAVRIWPDLARVPAEWFRKAARDMDGRGFLYQLRLLAADHGLPNFGVDKILALARCGGRVRWSARTLERYFAELESCQGVCGAFHDGLRF